MDEAEERLATDTRSQDLIEALRTELEASKASLTAEQSKTVALTTEKATAIERIASLVSIGLAALAS